MNSGDTNFNSRDMVRVPELMMAIEKSCHREERSDVAICKKVILNEVKDLILTRYVFFANRVRIYSRALSADSRMVPGPLRT